MTWFVIFATTVFGRIFLARVPRAAARAAERLVAMAHG